MIHQGSLGEVSNDAYVKRVQSGNSGVGGDRRQELHQYPYLRLLQVLDER